MFIQKIDFVLRNTGIYTYQEELQVMHFFA